MQVLTGTEFWAAAFDSTGAIRWYADLGESGYGELKQQPNGDFTSFVGASNGSTDVPSGHYVELRPSGALAADFDHPNALEIDSNSNGNYFVSYRALGEVSPRGAVDLELGRINWWFAGHFNILRRSARGGAFDSRWVDVAQRARGVPGHCAGETVAGYDDDRSVVLVEPFAVLGVVGSQCGDAPTIEGPRTERFAARRSFPCPRCH